ncbi:precorrin-6y C5,15-methyltransferase (decarboxylating) subunit CbiE [Aquisalimonas sp. 2447]|uniref:precorrin-6y C5,15-methyltransferase (decarboxylating) subunit CbiE n=1 Tax=Aquisalimonas sp. 2447 TaxID=2740807 RepID=UPI00143267EF|nr:precorrin-6y C5,15-methyltransferase (decarboxylating) subunit CbiE [Aquisalimonas sp. 2447]QIT56996.1 precorrin-6y C5,15-methyltransferase (decarboxylating) subunit CbiE [Aquisalimonas sp. 2447]
MSDVTPWLTIIGIGEDGVDGLPRAARDALAAADTVFGGERHLGLIPAHPGQERIAWPSPLDRALPWVTARRGRPTCVLASGDPFWYGIGATLAHHVEPQEISVHPAPSAFTLAAARMGWPLQQVRCLSVHGRALDRVRPWLHDGARLLLLSWDGSTAAALAGLLREVGFGASGLTVLSHMGGPNEQHRQTTAQQWADEQTADLNTIAVDCRAGAGARVIAATAGRRDDLFAHDGQITKREVRAATLAALAPGRGEVLWDVGAGSGAIAIEWMLADPANRAVAVERDHARSALVSDNARTCGVPDLQCVTGAAPDALADLPQPHAVFIGGGLTTPGLLERCREALPPGGRLVANSVTVEGEAVLARAAAQWGGELSRLAVSRAEPLGGFTGWQPLRPVTIWALEVA